VKRHPSLENCWDVTNQATLGKTEVEIVQLIIDAVGVLTTKEAACGDAVEDSAAPVVDHISPVAVEEPVLKNSATFEIKLISAWDLANTGKFFSSTHNSTCNN
jgi:protein-arginine kinase